MKFKYFLLLMPILMLASCSTNLSSTSSNNGGTNDGSDGTRGDDISSNDGTNTSGDIDGNEDDSIVKSTINTSAPSLGYYFAYDTKSSVPVDTDKLDINIHLGHASHIKDTFIVANLLGDDDIEEIKISNFDDYEFKITATLLNRDDETEAIELGQLTIDPYEYFENSKYEIGFYDIETNDKTCEQNVVFKNTDTFSIDLTKLKFDEGRWVIYYVSVKFMALNKNTNATYLIADNSECLFHKYDETRENILFSSYRFDEEIKPGGIKNNGWIIK